MVSFKIDFKGGERALVIKQKSAGRSIVTKIPIEIPIVVK